MTPKEFVALVDAWSATGGEFSGADRHVITTPDEVDAICRGLDSGHIFAANSIHTPAFFYLAAYFHYAKTEARWTLSDPKDSIASADFQRPAGSTDEF